LPAALDLATVAFGDTTSRAVVLHAGVIRALAAAPMLTKNKVTGVVVLERPLSVLPRPVVGEAIVAADGKVILGTGAANLALPKALPERPFLLAGNSEAPVSLFDSVMQQTTMAAVNPTGEMQPGTWAARFRVSEVDGVQGLVTLDLSSEYTEISKLERSLLGLLGAVFLGHLLMLVLLEGRLKRDVRKLAGLLDEAPDALAAASELELHRFGRELRGLSGALGVLLSKMRVGGPAARVAGLVSDGGMAPFAPSSPLSSPFVPPAPPTPAPRSFDSPGPFGPPPEPPVRLESVTPARSTPVAPLASPTSLASASLSPVSSTPPPARLVPVEGAHGEKAELDFSFMAAPLESEAAAPTPAEAEAGGDHTRTVGGNVDPDATPPPAAVSLQPTPMPTEPTPPAVTPPTGATATATANASATTDEPGEQGFREVYELFLRAREQSGESGALPYDKFRLRLQESRVLVVARHRCADVHFQVYVKNGKAAIKATPVQ
jgi:hypothetical protein